MADTLQMWTDVVSAVAAGIALCLSVVSLRQSGRSLRISERQEARQQPNLIATLDAGDYTTANERDDRRYRIAFSVQNRSDADNAIVRAELRLTYRLPEGIIMAARVQAAPESGLPFRLESRDSIRKECQFSVPATIWRHRIEAYTVELVDTYDRAMTMDPILLSERRA